MQDKQRRVLYIEDNSANVKLMENIFQLMGDDVSLHIAMTAEEGISSAAELKPDLILLDIQLPGMDGYEAFEQLKMNKDLEETPIFAITANAMTEHQERIKQTGFNEYISKPLNVKDLIELVKRYLD